MLIEFSVKNYRSIKDKATFSMVKGNGSELLENTFQPKTPHCPALLRSAAIYGANASGKSNLLKALKSMKRIVTEASQQGSDFKLSSYLMSEKTISAPSEFEVIFINNNVRYQYGFAATNDRVHEEWLFAFPVGSKQQWFYRQYKSDSKEEYIWELGSNLRGEKQSWKNQTRSNALFLSTAVQLNSEQLKPVFDWFADILRVVGVGGPSSGYSLSLLEDEEKKDKVVRFLNAADLGIKDLQLSKKQFSPESLPADMSPEFKQYVTKEMKGKEIFDLWSVHKDESGALARLSFSEESDGTRQLFDFAGPWMDTLDNGYVLFIDELHNHLHPLIVKYLVSMFHGDQSNVNNAQLIFTTHETSILDQEVLRRDQVWFCERKNDCATELYPLSDFSPRKGYENLEKNYLSGRYGALPYTHDIKLVSGS